MLLSINNVRIPLVSEASLREASARRLGVKKQDIGSIRVLRRAVDARRKSNIVINYHVLADIDAPARFVNRLLRDKDVTRFKEDLALLLVFVSVLMFECSDDMWLRLNLRVTVTGRFYWNAAEK